MTQTRRDETMTTRQTPGAEFQLPGNQASYPVSRAQAMAEAARQQYNEACDGFANMSRTLDELITAAKNLEFFSKMAAQKEAGK